jgi:hypothetical protein
MMLPPFALEAPTDSIGQWVLRILAVVGGAALGGFAVGLITQGLSRMLTTRPVPRVPLLIVRLLGAIVCGWVVFLLVFGGGLGGLGGGGGWSLFGGGGGPGGGSGKESRPSATGQSGGTGRDSGKAPSTAGLTLEVEVLPRRDAYRVQLPGGGSREFDFEGLKAYLLAQKRATPPVTGIRVSPGESDPSAPAVTRIIDWAGNNGLNTVTPPHPGP